MPTRAQLLEIIHFQSELAKLGVDLGEVMGLVVERVTQVTRADGAAIELAEGDEMVYRATAGIAKNYLGLRLKQSDSLSGNCVKTGECVYCPDTERDPRVNLTACRAIGLRSMLVIPLKYHDQTVGILKAMYKKPKGLSRREQNVLMLLSEVIGASIHFAVQFGGQDLFYRATHDSLTDLANRSLFMDRLRNVLSRCQREQSNVAVAVIDMDGLKPVNDTYGHRAGDAMIREFASRLRGVARRSDTAARIGGDEFAVILNPIDFPKGTEQFLHRFKQVLAPSFVFEQREYAIRASVGVAVYPIDGNNVDLLIEQADQRMYAHKHGVLNRY